MNPTAALMLSRELDEDRRRALEARRHRSIEPVIVDRPAGRPRTSVLKTLLRALFHVPHFRPAR